MIDNGKMDFAKLPEKFRTPAHISTIVYKKPEEAARIPAKYWTQDVLDAVTARNEAMFKYIDPANVPEDYLVGMAQRKSSFGTHPFGSLFFHELPKKFKTPRGVAASLIPPFSFARV